MKCALYLPCDDNLETDVVRDKSLNTNHAAYRTGIEFDPPNNFGDTSYNHDADAAVGTGALKVLDGKDGDTSTIIQIPDHASNRLGTGSCTLAFCIKALQGGFDANDRIIYKGGNFFMSVGGQQPTRLITRFGLGTAELEFDYADFFHASVAAWHRIAVVRDSVLGRMYLYKDGIVQTDVDTGLTYIERTPSDISYSGSDIFVGAINADFNLESSIIVDDILLLDFALTAEEAGYLSRPKGSYSNRVAIGARNRGLNSIYKKGNSLTTALPLHNRLTETGNSLYRG